MAVIYLYLYTIYYGFSAAGLLAAMLSAALPGGAQIYWMYSITMDTGNWMNYYNLSCISLVLLHCIPQVVTWSIFNFFIRKKS